MWLSWLEHHPMTKRLQVQLPVRAHTYTAGSIPSPGADTRNPCLRTRKIPSPGRYRRQPIDASLASMFFSLSLPLFKSNGGKKALNGVTQLIECQPVNQGVTGLIPSQGACLSCRPGPQLRMGERQPHINVYLPLFLPPFPSI